MRSMHVRTCRNTALMTTSGYTTTNGFLTAYQILTQSAQSLPRSSNGNICDTPQVARATCPRL